MTSMEIANFRPINTFINPGKIEGKDTIQVTKDPKIKAVDEATFARLIEADFRNGTIEVKVLSRLLENAPDFARGFIGIAFRINESNSKFECIYIRRPMEEPATNCEEIDLHSISHVQSSNLTVSEVKLQECMNLMQTWDLTSGSQ